MSWRPVGVNTALSLVLLKELRPIAGVNRINCAHLICLRTPGVAHLCKAGLDKGGDRRADTCVPPTPTMVRTI